MHRASLAIVYVTVFIDLLGFGIILPLLPYYAQEHGASGLGVGALLASYSAAQLVGAPILGRLSDRLGRRPVLLLSLAGSSLSLAATGLADTLPGLIAARAFAGLFAGGIATAQAYVADVTAPHERARYMGFLGASIGLGFVFGPAVGAALSPWGFAGSSFAAAGVAAANLAFASYALRESYPPEARRGRPPRASLDALRLAAEQPSTLLVLGATGFATLAFVALESTFALLGEHRFGLDERDMGLVFTYIGVVIVLVQGGLVGRLGARLGEGRMAVVGAALMVATFLVIGASHSLAVTLAALGLLSAGQGLVRPALAALLSFEADPDSQGGLLGLGQGVSAAARGVGPLLAGWLYDHGQGAPFVLGGAFSLGAAALVAAWLRRSSGHAPGTEPHPP